MSDPAAPIVLLAHVPHPAVLEGLLPAVLDTGRDAVLLTDQLEPTCASLPEQEIGRVRVLGCDVFNPLSAIAALGDAGIAPDAVLSNSDHLQTATAIVAAWFGCPGKDWMICLRAKNKAAVRQHQRPTHRVRSTDVARLCSKGERTANAGNRCRCRGAADIERAWRPRQSLISGRYTTRLSEIVHAQSW